MVQATCWKLRKNDKGGGCEEGIALMDIRKCDL